MAVIKLDRPSALHKRNKKKLIIIVAMLVITCGSIIVLSNNDNIYESINLSSTVNHSCQPIKAIRPLRNRDEMGDLLQEYNFKSGIEVGVKQGNYAEILLSKWTSCTNYKLVDLWKHQTNYKDVANVKDEKHESFYQETKQRLKPWSEKTEYYRMLSTEAAKAISEKNELVDFIYIDARHDYCGVKEDLEHYWPLLKPGGLIAGHDYNSNDEVRGQDWGLCQDGIRNDSAVKGAVNGFFVPKGITVSVNYRERNFHTWMAQKPLC